MLGYTNGQQHSHKCHLTTLGIQVCLLISWHEYVQWCYEVCSCVTQWSTSPPERTQMTLGISVLAQKHVPLAY
jgi:hypothetical protein